MGKRRNVKQDPQKGVKTKVKNVEPEVVPDRQSDDFYHDEVDKFHTERDTIPLDTKFAHDRQESDSEEEVLALESGDSEDSEDENMESEMAANLARLKRNLQHDDMASDIEDPEDGLPDSQAWGKLRHKYYGADVHDDDDIASDGSEMGAAELEEQEALTIQKRLAEQLDDQDFGLDTIKTTAKLSGDKKEIIVTKDLSKLSKREKLELLKKESPEFLDLIEDYRIKMKEANERLHPVLKKIKSGEIPESPATSYVDTKFRLILSYCMNVSYYLMLKTRRAPVHIHPVIGRIVQFRGLLHQLESADEVIGPSLDRLLERIRSGEDLKESEQPRKDVRRKTETKPQKQAKRSTEDGTKRKKISQLLDSDEEIEAALLQKKPKIDKSVRKSEQKAKVKEPRYETADEKEALEYYKMMKAGRRPEAEVEGASSDEEMAELRRPKPEAEGGSSGEEEGLASDGDEDDDEDVGKRGITKQIAKNRGLTPHRNKDNKNPRVKHRKKFRKAKIRRRGAVREFRPETKKYGGELSGIRAGVKKSIKLK